MLNNPRLEIATRICAAMHTSVDVLKEYGAKGIAEIAVADADALLLELGSQKSDVKLALVFDMYKDMASKPPYCNYLESQTAEAAKRRVDAILKVCNG